MYNNDIELTSGTISLWKTTRLDLPAAVGTAYVVEVVGSWPVGIYLRNDAKAAMFTSRRRTMVA
jgi:hypothetical protein